MQVVWFNLNHGFNHDHEAGVFSWNTKIIKIQFSIGSIEIVLHEDKKEREKKRTTRTNRWAASRIISSRGGGVEALMILNH